MILGFSFIIDAITGFNTENRLLFVIALPSRASLTVFTSIAVGFWLLFLGIPICAIVYIFKAYILRTTPISQACFFMPCTPQPISDWDQSGALFLALILFFGAEMVYPVTLYLRKRQRERRVLEQELQDVAEQIELVMTRRI